jgi:hypothetical protein
MKAVLLRSRRVAFEDGTFVEMVVWQLPKAVPPCEHKFKYSFVYIDNGERIIGYDNECGKGDHRHHYGRQEPYVFKSIETLIDPLRKSG